MGTLSVDLAYEDCAVPIWLMRVMHAPDPDRRRRSNRRQDRPGAGLSRAIEGAPSIYFRLGTVFNHESGDLFSRVLAGLRELQANLLVTVGREIDPASLGPQTANVRIERFVPQFEVLPHVDLVVSHGGPGSVLGALAHGRPMVVLPIGADQPLNAVRISALGAGRALDAIRATAAEVREAVASVPADGACREAAGRLADEIAALAPPGVAVALLERLAQGRRRLTAS